MEVKEAIEFLKDENIYRHFNAMDVTQKKFDKYNKSKQQVISLLQQGEKYRQMWEEFQYYIFGIAEVLPNKMNDLEQKYFPKKVIK